MSWTPRPQVEIPGAGGLGPPAAESPEALMGQVGATGAEPRLPVPETPGEDPL